MAANPSDTPDVPRAPCRPAQPWAAASVGDVFRALVVAAELLHEVEGAEAHLKRGLWMRLARVSVERALADVMVWAPLADVELRLPEALACSAEDV